MSTLIMLYILSCFLFVLKRLEDGGRWYAAILYAPFWPLLSAILAAEDVTTTMAKVEAKRGGTGK